MICETWGAVDFTNWAVARSEDVDRAIDSLTCIRVLFRSCSVKSALVMPRFGGQMRNV